MCRSKKNQSSAPLAFMRWIHRWLVNSPHKGSATLKMFPFDDIIMLNTFLWLGKGWYRYRKPGDKTPFIDEDVTDFIRQFSKQRGITRRRISPQVCSNSSLHGISWSKMYLKLKYHVSFVHNIRFSNLIILKCYNFTGNAHHISH